MGGQSKEAHKPSKETGDEHHMGWIFVVVSSTSFESLIMFLIVANGIYIGFATNYLATTLSSSIGVIARVFEFLFLLLFFIEIMLKIAVFRFDLFRRENSDGSINRNRTWNVYDCVVV